MNKRFGMVVDQERCIGCEACSVACRIENNASAFWIRVETQNVSQKDIPEGKFPDLRMDFLPRLCNHCEKPPCVDACPVEALVKRKDGPVVLNEGLCTKCQACLTACPYNSIFYNREKDLVEKCNLCAQRIDQGLEPFCVVCCEGQALHFGDLNDPNSEISQIIANQETFQLKPEAGTNPSVYYCPPKLKRRL